MSGITLAIAEKHLQACLDCELAIVQGAQSYTIDTGTGSRTITKANLYQVREEIKTWEQRIARLSPRRRIAYIRGIR